MNFFQSRFFFFSFNNSLIFYRKKKRKQYLFEILRGKHLFSFSVTLQHLFPFASKGWISVNSEKPVRKKVDAIGYF